MNKLGHGQFTNRSIPNQNRARRQQPQRVVDAADAAQPAQDRRAITSGPHTRAPNVIREPSALESFSRNLRTFLPINISTTPPSPSHSSSVNSNEEHARERIIWTAWDQVEHSRVLILAYSSGLQIWDATNLAAVRELLNLKAESFHSPGPILSAAILPVPVDGPDEYQSVRPLIGVLTSTNLTVFSLSTFSIVKQVSFSRASSFTPRSAFIVIATTHPHMLHILSSGTLLSLHTITLTTGPPIFALSLRLLAYVSPSPVSHTHSGPHNELTFVSRPHDSLSASVMRMGNDVWTGVKSAMTSGVDIDNSWGFSRSAPATSSLRRPQPELDRSPLTSSPGWVTVIDLGTLTSGAPKQVARFSPFPSEPAGIAHLTFSEVGAMPMLSVAPKDGGRVAVFQIRPGGVWKQQGTEDESIGDDKHSQEQMPWHWYDLRRGLTSAKVENVVWEKAGKWAGVITARRTIHIFPTNPYGGKPDERSHLEPGIYNTLELQPFSTEVAPLVRLRPGYNVHSSSPVSNSTSDVVPVPLAVTFLPPSASFALPSVLRPRGPPVTRGPQPIRIARSPPSPPYLSSASARDTHRLAFQDVLLFDAASGELALRRITLEWVSHSSELPGMPYAVGSAAGYSMSLPIPIMGHGRGSTDAREKQGELEGKETLVATWDLKRGPEWGEVRGSVPSKRVDTGGPRQQERGKVSPTDYLAQAELSTHSRSPAVLPRSIYLSHQFSFYALGEDYHALLRRSQLDIPCTKIEVRKDVEVSAYTDDVESDAFVQSAMDLQADSRARRAARGSFDEPIASAIRSSLDYSGQSPPVLPMLPNGASMSVLDVIPIHTRHVASGVNEGLGRIRREIGKVRSPILRPTRPDDHGRHVPLEFDEEDETIFLQGDELDVDHEGTSHDGSGSGASASVSTPSTRSRADLNIKDTSWDAWDDETRATVAEVEMFDEISPTGFMDEEHIQVMTAMSRSSMQNKGKEQMR